MTDWSQQRVFEDVTVGDEIEPVAFPLTVYRLIMAAGANRDFNPIHHNGEYARWTGAPEMYANTMFLQSMWERAVREYIGLDGTIRRLRGFRMSSFNVAGDTVVVRGRVARVFEDDGHGLVELEIWSENAHGVSVGPGSVEVSLPRRET